MRMIDADKVLKIFKKWIDTKQVEGEKLRAVETCIVVIEDMSTPSPPNEWVSRVLELDELYTKLQTVTGFTAEQLLEMFKAGYTLEKPDYSKHFEAMANLAESDPPNEPLTCDGCNMQNEKVTPCASCIRDPRVCDYYTRRLPERQEDNNDGD